MYYLETTTARPVATDWRADVTRNGMLPPDDYVIERDQRQIERIEYQRSLEDDFVLF